MTDQSPIPSIRYAWRDAVVDDYRLTHAQLRVLLALESCANADGTNAHPGVENLAARLLKRDSKTGEIKAMSEKTVRDALALGRELGYLIRTQKGRKGRNRNYADVYRLGLPEVWATGSHESGLPEVWTTGSREDVDATTGNSGPTTGNSAPDYRKSELPPTSPFPTSSSNTSSYSSAAGESNAGVHEAEAEAAEWIRNVRSSLVFDHSVDPDVVSDKHWESLKRAQQAGRTVEDAVTAVVRLYAPQEPAQDIVEAEPAPEVQEPAPVVEIASRASQIDMQVRRLVSDFAKVGKRLAAEDHDLAREMFAASAGFERVKTAVAQQLSDRRARMRAELSSVQSAPLPQSA
ncbi:helix-turn-helix domain-containing protein [Rhodococcus sp. T2V]|uniref:helix-turn-helix domain-containing protein n=1 Tax=Rhodococcus sp. T2V TaxID=3034164 RepID=UPI0023E309B8|nr:helix-turn-helix domain-containing protein [Rhodococcus sp. T2V]MDF3313450.1 helix-turn-helix domain-containing protein [Rhodococcus sp. T2V]